MKKQVLCYMSLLIISILYPYSVFAKASNDPYFEQWAYEATGVYDAWNITTGSHDVVVAIIDNGFDTFHPDLRDNIWVNKDEIPRNGIDDDKNGYVDDINGWNFLSNSNNPRPDVVNLSDGAKSEGIFNHGTLVAGIIGAKGNNHQDGAGINWDVQLMNLKVLGNGGSGDFFPVVDAIRYAVDNGADVINISMVGEGNTEAMYDAVKYAHEQGVVVVAAAGNNLQDLDKNPIYPICLDAGLKNIILGVSAIGEDNHLAIFSNTGSNCIDITAPGVDIQSTMRFSPKDGLIDSYSTDIWWDGTSFAAPFISGAAALIKSVQPSWDAAHIFDALLSTVHHTPGQDEDVYADLFGAGLIQIDKAVAYASGKTIDTDSIDTIEEDAIEIPETVSSYDVSSRVMYIAPRTGEYEIKSYGKEATEIKHRFTFAGIQDVSSYVDAEGYQRYVALKGDTEDAKDVYIYDENVRFLNTWTFEKTGNYNIVVGDIDGDSIPEIIFAPQNSATQYFYIYSIDGYYISTYTKDISHDGAIVDLVYNVDRGAYDIVLLYTIGNDSYIEQMDNNFNIKHNSILENIVGGEILVFDIDQDGLDEYVIGAAPGKQAYIYVIDQDGTESYRFRGYPPQMKQGMDMAVIDYGDDGIYDLVLTPRVGGSPVRIMSVTGEVLESWWPLGSQDVGRVFAISLN